MNRKPLGTQVRNSLSKNCLLCSRWVACRDPSKDMNYACSKFTSEHELDLRQLLEEDYETAHAKTSSGLLVPVNNNSLIGSQSYNTKMQVYSQERDEETNKLLNADPKFALENIISEVLNSGVPVAPDLRIDDRDINKPRNIVEWITKPEFIGGEEKPFGKQIQIMAHYFAEWCPDCSDEDYFECVPVEDRLDDIKEHVVFLNNGVCPRCKANKVDLVEDEVLIDPFELVGIVGQRGTKTISSTMMESYSLARWLMTPNIPSTYHILPSTILTSTYTATTFGQAKANFWDPFNSLLLGSEWFKNYHKFLDEVGRKYGEELYKHSETLIAYRHKNIFSSPASPSKRSLRGRTRIGAVIDEAGWFRSGKTKGGDDFERMDGNEVYTALKRSMTTMRAAYIKRFRAGSFNIPKPLITLVSSPSARNDLIMTRFRESQGSRETYSFKYPTWEFNPLVTREILNEEFRTKPIESARDYGCEPPMATNAWIADEELVEGSFCNGRNAVGTMTRRYRTKSRKLVTSANFKRLRKLDYDSGAVMGIDVGHNNNSFAIAIAYPTTIPDVEDEDNEEVFVGVDFPIVIEVIPKKDYPISQTGLYNELIKPLCELFNVAVVVSDSWQNKKIVQDLDEAIGVEHYEIKLTLSDFDDYKQCLYDKLIEHPKLDMPMEQIINMPLDNYPDCFAKYPVAHLAFQMLTVQHTGNAVVKGQDGTTDDILRACVVAHTALQDEEILEICLEFTDDSLEPTQALSAMAIGTAKGSAGGYVQQVGMLVSRNNTSPTGSSNGIGVKVARK